ncbi:hypothetical protein EGW08_022881 [Elysia chlorotica]|uniref:peptidylprolyl isomerase n=1 Tax=Elysia chlorotica TaxID=188477 RepID=A0A3S1GZQ3_ELYCH|nr:hypothetical protein EGW08_022881 [Elysia chlorotica]
MHFKFRLKDGSIAEDTENYGKPFGFQMGQGCFTDKVEQELIDAKVGDSKRIVLMPEEAFGDQHPASIYSVPKSRFPKDMVLEEGLIVSFKQKDGSDLPGLITDIEEKDVTVDFNHPLAGQIIVFETKILGVYASEEEMNEDSIS